MRRCRDKEPLLELPAYAEQFGFDIRALYRDAKEREGAGGRAVVSLKPRRIEPVTSEKAARQA